MNMHFRHGFLHGFHNFKVGLTGVFGMNTALHAHLGRTTIPGFSNASLNLFVGKIVRSSA